MIKKIKIGLVNKKLCLVPTPVPTTYSSFPPTTCSPPPTPSDAIHLTLITFTSYTRKIPSPLPLHNSACVQFFPFIRLSWPRPRPTYPLIDCCVIALACTPMPPIQGRVQPQVTRAPANAAHPLPLPLPSGSAFLAASESERERERERKEE